MTSRGALRVIVAAFGDPGHVFPAIALARSLAARGHEVKVETWPQWQEAVESCGLGFESADAYQVFPPPRSGRAGSGEAALALMPLLEDFQPHVVVNDILTLAPALAAEKYGCRRATLIPHVYPVQQSGMPFFAVGALPPRTTAGKLLWKQTDRLLERGLVTGRDDLNAQREIVGLAPTVRFHGGISPDLAMVATFPHLEYPRRWPAGVHLTGPMPFELPYPDIELPPGEDPLVLVAPSTSQDPKNRLVRASLKALAGERVRVVASTNRVEPDHPIEVPPNAVLVDWVSYSQVIPQAALVICHGGHGTVARALSEGVPVLTSPAAGDMNETAARITWAGVGLSVRWSLAGPRPIRWAAGELLGNRSYRERAGETASWARANDGAATGAALVEALATD